MSSPAKKKTSLREAPPKADQLLLPSLPQDIITDHILILLPVQTLIRFKCICKLWLYLISSTDFIKRHLMKSSRLNNSSHHRIIVRRRFRRVLGSRHSYPHSLKSSPIDSIFHPQIDHNKPVEYKSNTWISIVGSCNGLVCFATERQATVLWNPSTRESKRLPDLDGNLEKSQAAMSGFGYDQFNDDYKVLMARIFESHNQVVEEVMVYSLKKNLWRKIEIFSPHPIVQYEGQGVFVNGALHWEVEVSSDFSLPPVIISFHLGTEMYGEIVRPNLGDGDCEWNLTVFEEYLSIYSYSMNIGRIDIWVMKEYGRRDSWIKMHTIKHMVICKDDSHFQYVPLCSIMSDIILFRFQVGFVRYDPNNGTLKKSATFEFSNWPLDFVPTTYVESLVSPNTYNKVGLVRYDPNPCYFYESKISDSIKSCHP